MDYRKLAEDILEKVGGSGNVQNVGHCVTRLRVTCKNTGLADREGLKALSGVQGLVEKDNELQIIIGTDVS